jgi:hypothetical protein
MTAKEKALKLCQGFIMIVTGSRAFDLSMAKKCATVCVDEILKLYDGDYQDKRDKTYWHPYDYWLEVKSEIQKLT